MLFLSSRGVFAEIAGVMMAFCAKCGNELLPKSSVIDVAWQLNQSQNKNWSLQLSGLPYKSPIAETYYDVLRSAAEEKLAKHPKRVRHREGPMKLFERRVKARS